MSAESIDPIAALNFDSFSDEDMPPIPDQARRFDDLAFGKTGREMLSAFFANAQEQPVCYTPIAKGEQLPAQLVRGAAILHAIVDCKSIAPSPEQIGSNLKTPPFLQNPYRPIELIKEHEYINDADAFMAAADAMTGPDRLYFGPPVRFVYANSARYPGAPGRGMLTRAAWLMQASATGKQYDGLQIEYGTGREMDGTTLRLAPSLTVGTMYEYPATDMMVCRLRVVQATVLTLSSVAAESQAR